MRMTDVADYPKLGDWFWEKVDVKSYNECWHWTACRKETGYGQVRRLGTNYRAHRLSRAEFFGIPTGAVVRHTCDEPSCVNPYHLQVGTQKENLQDMHRRGRRTYASKLSAQDVRDMRNSYKAGVLQKDLATQYGVSPGYVSTIVNHKRLKSIR